MNRMAMSALGATAALALSVGGASTASATARHDDPKGDQDKVEVVKVYDKFTLPAYAACKDPIKVKIKAKITVKEINENKAYVEFAHWSTQSFYNPKTHKSITVNVGSKAIAKYKEEDTRVRGYGGFVFYGAGVKGIVYTKGEVRFTVEDDATPNQKVVIEKVKGKYVELCKKLGSKPVEGKNPAPVE